MTTLGPADSLAILQLIALYGHIVDERDWMRLDDVFTADVVFDATDLGAPLRTNLEQLKADWARPETKHPFAHHSTNVVIDPISDLEVRVVSKGIGLRPGGQVGSVVYRDVLRLTPVGWRIARRHAMRRKDPGTLSSLEGEPQ